MLSGKGHRAETLRKTLMTHHDPGFLFDVVSDIETYPLFVPHCRSLRIVERRAASDHLQELVAEMHVVWGVLSDRMRTRVFLNRPDLTISVDYISGPFRDLKNCWYFRPRKSPDRGTCVEFMISYRFRSAVLGALASGLAPRLSQKMTESFLLRADALSANEASVGLSKSLPD